MKTSSYFIDVSEGGSDHLYCPATGFKPPIRTFEKLVAARIIYGKPIYVTSGVRGTKHNFSVGGKPGSMHLPAEQRSGESKFWKGGAFDMIIDHSDEWRFIQILQFVGFTGIGIDNNNFIHADDRDAPAQIWTY